MIRKLKSGEYRLYSRKKDPKTGERRNLTFKTRCKRCGAGHTFCSTQSVVRQPSTPERFTVKQ